MMLRNSRGLRFVWMFGFGRVSRVLYRTNEEVYLWKRFCFFGFEKKKREIKYISV